MTRSSPSEAARPRSAAIALTGVFLAGALTVLLSACAGTSPPKPPEPNVMPENYKTKIMTELRTRLADPVGVRDAAVSEPTLKQTGNVERYISCVRYNSKDESGAYSGIKERAVYFYHGEITQVIDNEAGNLCRGAPYQPWPELMQMCKEIVCPGR